MAKLSDVIGYICENYPHKNELSKARLTKMIYLADWKSSLEFGEQTSNIKWIFNHYGPYVDDVINTVRSDNTFKVITEFNAYGDTKDRIVLSTSKEWNSLSAHDKSAINHVIEQTRSLWWKDFIKLVYSTFPVMVSERQTTLNLPELAGRYKQELKSRA